MYPFTKTETKCCNIASQQSVFIWNHINSTYVPNFVAVAFTESDGLLGSLKKNPYNFAHFKLQNISLKVDGISAYDISCNYDERLTMEVLDRLYGYTRHDHLSSALPSLGNGDRSLLGIDGKELSKGKAVYVFDLKPSLNDSQHLELLRSGTLSIEANFGQPLQNNVCAIVYMEYDGLFTVDESRTVRLI